MSGCAFIDSTGKACGKRVMHGHHAYYRQGPPSDTCHEFTGPEPAEVTCPECGGGKPGVTGKDSLCQGCWERKYYSRSKPVAPAPQPCSEPGPPAVCRHPSYQPIPPPVTPDAPLQLPDCAICGHAEDLHRGGFGRISDEPRRCWHESAPGLEEMRRACPCRKYKQPSPPTQGEGDAVPCAGGCDHSPGDHIDMLVSANKQLRALNDKREAVIDASHEVIKELNAESAALNADYANLLASSNSYERERDELRARLAEAAESMGQKLAAVSVAAQGNAKTGDVAQDSPFWSVAYEDVRRLRVKYEEALDRLPERTLDEIMEDQDRCENCHRLAKDHATACDPTGARAK